MAANIRRPKRIRKAARAAMSTGWETRRPSQWEWATEIPALMEEALLEATEANSGLVAIIGTEGQRDAKGAGDVDFEQDLERVSFFVRGLQQRAFIHRRLFEWTADGLDARESGFKLGIQTRSQRRIQMTQILFQAGAIGSVINCAGGLEERENALLRRGAAAVFDAVKLPRDRLGKNQNEIDAFAGLLEGLGEVIHHQAEALLSPGEKFSRSPLIAGGAPVLSHLAGFLFEVSGEQ